MTAAQRKHFCSAEKNLAHAAAHLEDAARSLHRAAAEAETLRRSPDRSREYTVGLTDLTASDLARQADRIAEMADHAGGFAEGCSG